MSYQALYRKYRPRTFDDVYGQEHITETLKKELTANTTVHAYLFTGTRGTGKTSCAKILAAAVNCTNLQNGNPCMECDNCRAAINGENTDIVEIDAASNNSVEDIRELRERINFAPSVSKYRVYIIDEVHMLSLSAFNALLKTLEEPPAHVIFILATTEVHKLPATILSRCQRFDFRRISPQKICERLQYISEKEDITLTEPAAELIASVADGGMRDALSILDLCASDSKKIDESVVESVCAMAGSDYLLELADFIKRKDTENALLMLDRLHNSSVDMLRLLSELISHYRDLMIIKIVKHGTRPIVCSSEKLQSLENQAENYDIKDIIFTLNCLQNATALMQNGNRRCEMEMTIIKLCNPEISVDIDSLERRITALEQSLSNSSSVHKAVEKPINTPALNISDDDTEDIPLPEPPEAEYENTEPIPKKNIQNTSQDSIRPVEEWHKILEILKSSAPLIAGVLNNSNAYIKGDYLLIDSKNSQFRTLIKSSNGIYKDHIRKAAEQVLGNTYKLGPYSVEKTAKANDPLLTLAEKLKNLEN